jgi:hypothetical protein
MKTISFNGFTAALNKGVLTIAYDGESREYVIKEVNKGIEYEEGSEYFYIRTDKGFYYQFKFEVDDSFIGDKFSDEDEFLDTFACFVFGEN